MFTCPYLLGPRRAKEKRQVSTAYLVRHKHWVIFPLSAWYEATRRKRPHSPAGDESVRNNNVREPASKGAGTPVLWLVRYLTGYAEKRRKKEQQELEDEQESNGEEITKKSQSGVYSIPGRLLILILIIPQLSTLIAPVSPLTLPTLPHVLPLIPSYCLRLK